MEKELEKRSRKGRGLERPRVAVKRISRRERKKSEKTSEIFGHRKGMKGVSGSEVGKRVRAREERSEEMRPDGKKKRQKRR